jgi:hypothetical protein
MKMLDWIDRTASAAVPILLVLVAVSLSTVSAFGKVAVVAFGLFGDQSVFESEANGAARILAARFGAEPVIVRANTKQGGDATARTLKTVLRGVTSEIDRENDVLFVILTSHGSPEGLAVKAGRRTEMLSPAALAEMLDDTGIRHRVVIVSACYSGVFIPPLASPDTLVITAADAEHPSFGCQDGARWTYFGDAFFNTALRHNPDLKQAFLMARQLVRNRERRNGFAPSNPQIAGGENLQPLLAGNLATH